MATFQELGDHVGISKQAASEFYKKNNLSRALSVDEFRLFYCRSLREVAAGRKSEDGGLDLAAERARLAKEQADKLEMENAEARGELVKAEDVEEAWGGEFERVRARLLAIPPKLGPLAVGLTSPNQAKEIAETLVHEALDELSKPVEADKEPRKGKAKAAAKTDR